MRAELPAGWADAARSDGYVTMAIGPCTAHWDDISPGAGDLSDDLDDLLRCYLVTGYAAAARCACAALAPHHVAELVDAHVLAAALIPVIAEES